MLTTQTSLGCTGNCFDFSRPFDAHKRLCSQAADICQKHDVSCMPTLVHIKARFTKLRFKLRAVKEPEVPGQDAGRQDGGREQGKTCRVGGEIMASCNTSCNKGVLQRDVIRSYFGRVNP